MITIVHELVIKHGSKGTPSYAKLHPQAAAYKKKDIEAMKPLIAGIKDKETRERVKEVLPFFHTRQDIEAIANRKGTVNVYHGAPKVYAQALVDRINQGERKAAWNSADEMLRHVAKTYDIPYTELKNKTGLGHFVNSYSLDKVSWMSTAPAEVASRWAKNFPYGEIMSTLNSDARIYLAAKAQGMTFDDFYEKAVAKAKAAGKSLAVEHLADSIKLPDKLAGHRKGGSLVEVTVDARAISESLSREAKNVLKRMDENKKEAAIEMLSWNVNYKDMKIHPGNIIKAKIVKGIKVKY